MNWQTAEILVGGVATLAIFSFLIKENPVYRFFEHLFIGIATGFGVITGLKNFLWPQIIKPMLGLDIVQFPDGTYAGEHNPWLYLYILPMLFGLLYYFIFSKRFSWLSKIVIGFSLGIGGGLAFKAFFNEMIPQITMSFKPLAVYHAGKIDYGASFANTFFVATLLIVMYYFFFSFRREGMVSKKLNMTGRWLLMICFGAFFGSTVMARLALLVERLQFLWVDWRGEVTHLFFS